MEAKAQKSGTKKARNRRKNSFSRPKAISKIILIALAALSLVAAVLYIFLGKPGKDEIEQVIDDGTILQGITVNGVDVAGMNYKQAREAVLPSVEEDLRSIHITVSHSTNMWLLTAADIKPSSTLDAAITEALTLGRGGTVIENAKDKEDIAQNGRDIPITFVPNEAALKVRLAEIGGVLDSEPAEPYAVAVSSSAEPEFIFHEGVDGYMLDEDALYQNIASLLSAGQLKATLEPELEYTKPQMTIDDVKAHTKPVSSFQTSFGGSRAARDEKRVGNIQKACTLLNGMKVENGTEFNFNAYIGPRTEAGGWPLAPGIVNGNQYEDQPGGGVCQVSTTMYEAVLMGDYNIVYRQAHSSRLSYVPGGLDATINTGTIDFKWSNNTEAPVYVFTWIDKEQKRIWCEIYGLPFAADAGFDEIELISERLPNIEPTADEYITYSGLTAPYWMLKNEAKSGYAYDTFKSYKLNGVEVKREPIANTIYRMHPRRYYVWPGYVAGTPLQAEYQLPLPQKNN